MPDAPCGFFSRRHFLKLIGGLATLPAIGLSLLSSSCSRTRPRSRLYAQNWPTPADWERLAEQVGGRLIPV